jgi:hypothetical protein
MAAAEKSTGARCVAGVSGTLLEASAVTSTIVERSNALAL